jgi:cytochrome c
MKPAIAMIAAAAFGLAHAAPAQAQEALARSSGCLACHAVDAKKMGPSFKDTAAKYKGNAEAEAMLLAKLGEGKKHPATKAKPEDLKAVVKWILAM